MKCALGRCIALSLSLLPGIAFGEGANAEELYRTGVAEFEKGNYDAACQAFGASYRAEPLLGALFTLATCEMRAGRLATAVERYGEYLSRVAALPAEQRSAQAERREVAEAERKALLKKLPYLKIVATELLQSRAVIKLDGVVLERSRLGVELAVNPGDHVIEVGAADGTTSAVRVALLPREHKSVVLSPVGVTAARIETTTPASEQPPAPAETSSTPVAGYVLLGVGLLGVGVGSVAGMRALDHKAIVDDECNGPACSPRGHEQAEAGQTAALVSTIGFGVGAAGLATALVLFVTHGPDSAARGQGKSRLAVTLSPRWLAVSGGF